MRIVHVVPNTGPVAAENMAKCCDGLTVVVQGNHVVVLEGWPRAVEPVQPFRPGMLQ